MTLVLTPRVLTFFAGGLLLYALGSFALRARPRTRASIAFGVFCLALGTSIGILAPIGIEHPWYGVKLAIYIVSDLVAAASVLAVASSIPRATGRLDPRRFTVPVRAVRVALRGGVTREEEVHLHEAAEHMGIGAGRAMPLRLEVEREMAGAARGVA